MLDEKLKNQYLVEKIVFWSLTASIFMYGSLVVLGLLNPPDNIEEVSPNDLLNPANLIIYLSIFIIAINFAIRKKFLNLESLKLEYRKLTPTYQKLGQNARISNAEFQSMDEASQKKMILSNRIFIFEVISWAMNESIAVFGIAALFLGRDNSYFYATAAIAVGLNLMMMPKMKKLLNELKPY